MHIQSCCFAHKNNYMYCFFDVVLVVVVVVVVTKALYKCQSLAVSLAAPLG